MTLFVTIIGRTVKDPEKKMTKNNQEFYSFRIASSNYTSQNNTQENTLWWNGTVWSNLIPKLSKKIEKIKKGSLIVLEGTIQEATAYESQNDELRHSIELNISNIKFLPAKRSTERSAETNGFTQNVYDESQQQLSDPF